MNASTKTTTKQSDTCPYESHVYSSWNPWNTHQYVQNKATLRDFQKLRDCNIRSVGNTVCSTCSTSTSQHLSTEMPSIIQQRPPFRTPARQLVHSKECLWTPPNNIKIYKQLLETRLHAHAHAHTCTHTRTRTHTHAHTCSHTHTCTHTHACAHVHAHTRRDAHSRKYTHRRTHT